MSDEKPPPYSVIMAGPILKPPISAAANTASVVALPFDDSSRFAISILALVSEGKTLDAHFRDMRDVASSGAKFEYQENALVLCQRFETLVWESRKIAGIALVAMKDFNEIVLDFLSEPDVVVQDRLKELANSSKLLQRERDPVTIQKSSFNALVKELEDFHHMIHSELGALMPKRRRTRVTRPSRKSKPPFIKPRSEPLRGLSTVTASLGAISRNCMSYALQVERIAEQTVFPSCFVNPPPEEPAQDINPTDAPADPPERKRLCPSVEHAELTALPGLVDALVRELRAFVSRTDVFATIFAELARAQDVFIVYLKDGQSIVNQGYRSEINRLRRHLPCVCNALDSYSKARLSSS